MKVSTQAPKIQNYIRGDSRTLIIPVYQSDGVTPFNLTGCTVYFTLNAAQQPSDDGTDSTAVIKKSVTGGFLTTYGSLPTAAYGWIAQITLQNTDTQPLTAQTYYYDVQLKDNAGNIYSLGSNQFSVIDDITTRVS